jgi:hypothetical protein
LLNRVAIDKNLEIWARGGINSLSSECSLIQA